jgi:AraC-like DNA-binding protein
MVMKRAVEVFALEARSSGSSLIERTWSAVSVPEESFISVAATHWEMVVTRQRDTVRLTVRGPETRATIVPIPRDAQFFGIDFSPGTFMPALPPGRLVDRALMLPTVSAAPGVSGVSGVSGTSFWLDGAAWEVPGPDDAEVFVDRLVRAGLLVHDPVVAEALDGGGDGDVRDMGDVVGYSTRSVERRVARATGLSRGAIGRIRRAERAVELMAGGVAAGDVARRMGYADQPHLTRSLRRFVGQTPSQVARAAPDG